MRKPAGFCAGVVLLSATSALAAPDSRSVDFPMNGRWKGAATVMDEKNRVKDCGNVEIEVRQSAKEFELPDGLDNCQIISEFIDPARFEIRSGKLLLSGKEVGELTDTSAHIEVTDEKDGFHELLELHFENGNLAYRDTITLVGGEDSGSLTIKSILKRQQ